MSKITIRKLARCGFEYFRNDCISVCLYSLNWLGLTTYLRLKDIALSAELYKHFGHDSEKWISSKKCEKAFRIQ